MIWVPTTRRINEAVEALERGDKKPLEDITRELERQKQRAQGFVLFGFVGAVATILYMFSGLLPHEFSRMLPLPEVPFLVQTFFILTFPLMTLLGFFLLNRVARARRDLKRRPASAETQSDLHRVQRQLERLIELGGQLQGHERSCEVPLLRELEQGRREIEATRQNLEKHQDVLCEVLRQLSGRLLAIESRWREQENMGRR